MIIYAKISKTSLGQAVFIRCLIRSEKPFTTLFTDNSKSNIKFKIIDNLIVSSLKKSEMCFSYYYILT